MALTPRVLLVDDNAALVDNLRETLEDEGYVVATAGTVAEAAKAASSGFDVALVDLRLPDGDGTALTEKLRRDHPDAAIVMLTGNATVETAAAAVRAGAFAYLVKPATTPDLLLTLEQALRQVRLQAEKRELSRRAQVAEKLAAVGTMTAGLSHCNLPCSSGAFARSRRRSNRHSSSRSSWCATRLRGWSICCRTSCSSRGRSN